MSAIQKIADIQKILEVEPNGRWSIDTQAALEDLIYESECLPEDKEETEEE